MKVLQEWANPISVADFMELRIVTMKVLNGYEIMKQHWMTESECFGQDAAFFTSEIENKVNYLLVRNIDLFQKWERSIGCIADLYPMSKG